MANVLEIRNLTKTFGGLRAVDSFTMNITNDKIHALIGPNGSGKTTTINMISGVIKADSGQVLYNGQNILGKSTDEIAKLGIVRTFQNIKLFQSLTVLENAMVGGHAFTGVSMASSLLNLKKRAHEEKVLREEAMAALDYVGLASLANEQVNNLPYYGFRHGQKLVIFHSVVWLAGSSSAHTHRLFLLLIRLSFGPGQAAGAIDPVSQRCWYAQKIDHRNHKERKPDVDFV